MIVNRPALEFGHGHGVGTRRRWLTVAQQLARVATRTVGAPEVLTEPTALQPHFSAALLALQDRSVIALEAELAGLYLVPIAVRTVTAQMQFARFVDQIGVHGGVAGGTAPLGPQSPAFPLFVRIGVHRFLSGDEIHGARTALSRWQRVSRTSQKHAGTGRAHLHRAFAVIAPDCRGNRLIRPHAFRRPSGLEPLRKIVVEGIQHATPLPLSQSNLVEFLLHVRSKRIIEQVTEVFHQPVGHQFADLLGLKAPFVETDIATFLYGGDDGRIGGRPTDTALLKLTYQTRLAIAGGWLGKMLYHVGVKADERVTLAEIGQLYLIFLARGRR